MFWLTDYYCVQKFYWALVHHSFLIQIWNSCCSCRMIGYFKFFSVNSDFNHIDTMFLPTRLFLYHTCELHWLQHGFDVKNNVSVWIRLSLTFIKTLNKRTRHICGLSKFVINHLLSDSFLEPPCAVLENISLNYQFLLWNIGYTHNTLPLLLVPSHLKYVQSIWSNFTTQFNFFCIRHWLRLKHYICSVFFCA